MAALHEPRGALARILGDGGIPPERVRAELDAPASSPAVVLSRKGQIDLGLQIALGSSTQIALLVAPVLVFAGVLMGRGMDLVFTPFEVLALGMATGVTAISTLDWESHWFEGVQLLAVYLMVAVGAFFL